MKYRVTSAAVDTTATPPEFVVMKDGGITTSEVIDTDTNQLFGDCRTPWDIEDRFVTFWNRLNDRDEVRSTSRCTHPKEKVIVLSIERA